MSKYTKESPLEFEGGTLWRNRQGGIAYNMPHEVESRFKPGENTWLARAHHAFIEAERNEWHWTNADKTEARKGRWEIHGVPSTGRFNVFHDDFPSTTWYDRSKEYTGDGPGNDVADVVRDFLAWHAAQQQPEEPTGLGAVVEVAEMEPCEPGATERFVLTVESSHNKHPWRLEGYPMIHGNWALLTKRASLTVLSAGVES